MGVLIYILNIRQNLHMTEAAAFFQRWAGSARFEAQGQTCSWHTTHVEVSPFSAKKYSLGFLLSSNKRGEELHFVFTTTKH